MNWTVAIERNRDALKRIVTSLADMAALGSRKPTLPRHLHRHIVSLLRPAEAATRRLIIALACGIVVKVPPLRPARPEPKSSFAKDGKGTGIILPRGVTMLPATELAQRGAEGGNAPTRKLSFSLLDPIRRSAYRRGPKRTTAIPRISTPGYGTPFPLPVRKPPSPDGSIFAARLNLRIAALTAALDDMPRQALRFARWKARADTVLAEIQQQADALQNGARLADIPSNRRARRLYPLRAGRPPGGRLKRWNPDAPRRRGTREIDEILAHAHELAIFALEKPDTS